MRLVLFVVLRFKGLVMSHVEMMLMRQQNDCVLKMVFENLQGWQMSFLKRRQSCSLCVVKVPGFLSSARVAPSGNWF